jgi:diguanylate cyclase (GGDEF)-like protein
LNQLLHHVDLITRCRKRGEIEAAVVAAIHLCLRARRTELYKVYMPSGDVLVGLAAEIEDGKVVSHDDGFSWPEHTGSIENAPFLQESFGSDAPQITQLPDGGVRLVLMLRNAQHEPFGFLAVLREKALSGTELDIVRGMAALLKNSLAFLEYGETDTLTRLLNRKTFDEYLLNILANIPPPDETQAGTPHLPQRRHAHPVARDHWLGVMDIDHFKSINDRFGHLIGDEVLILMANLMRESFRAQDKLFRFGGEEFVALIRPAEFAHAQRTFERFRSCVEKYVFPQVGHVTISIGFARIRLGDTTSRILDSADEALYWAKEHGRNQCHAYETLIAAGKLTRPVAPDFEVELF